jgi:hypothetical protein
MLSLFHGKKNSGPNPQFEDITVKLAESPRWDLDRAVSIVMPLTGRIEFLNIQPPDVVEKR